MLSLRFPGLRWLAALAVLSSGWLNAAEVDGFDLPAILAAAQARGTRVVLLQPGNYRLPAQGLKLEKLKQFTIEGNGATLVAINREAPALRILGCESLTLRNLQIDYDPLPFTQGKVTAVDAKKRSAEVKLHDGYPGVEVLVPANGSFVDARLQLFRSDVAAHKPGSPDYAVARFDKSGDRTVSVFFPDWQIGVDKIEVGDRVTLSSRAAEGVTIRQSRDVVMENVSIWSAPNVALLVRSNEDGGTFRRVRLAPGPTPVGATEPRLMSACSDGLNIADARVGPVVEGCEFAFQGDDGINIHGPTLPIIKKIDDRNFLTMLPWKNNHIDAMTRSGDVIRFLRAPSYSVVGEGVIRQINVVKESPEAWMAKVREIWSMLKISSERVTFYRITLDRCPPGVEAGMFCDLPALSGSGFLIRNSSFHDHRARGLRIQTSDGVISNNTFERIKGCAISLGAEYAFWREAGWSRNVIITGNRIIDVGQGMNILLPDSYTPGAISIIARTDEGDKTPFQGNQNIVIEHNTIERCSVAGISVTKARNVQVRWNEIREVWLGVPQDKKTPRNSIVVSDATVEISDNLMP